MVSIQLRLFKASAKGRVVTQSVVRLTGRSTEFSRNRSPITARTTSGRKNTDATSSPMISNSSRYSWKSMSK